MNILRQPHSTLDLINSVSQTSDLTFKLGIFLQEKPPIKDHLIQLRALFLDEFLKDRLTCLTYEILLSLCWKAKPGAASAEQGMEGSIDDLCEEVSEIPHPPVMLSGDWPMGVLPASVTLGREISDVPDVSRAGEL
ncbi:hypothetical protein QAD02_023526 [Eretmocerus hayati]|uniref:Uncharacterized protein n=1 Tax=Eretmocerus hayati TaxID=131215 RepID=A0ACC2PZF7_9HYME|nr:hypothetical protein QAD02_023526 [Eretmocerus hayati]